MEKRDKYIITYVVLHYKTLEDTCACVESILRTNSIFQKELVIVDNGSNDESSDKLKKQYGLIDNIHIIVNTENLGFARGNNTGYLFAKETLRSDFIILLNNDTEIDDYNFSQKIVEEYYKHHYYVLGPDIEDNTYGHVNPAGVYILTLLGTYTFEKNCKKKIRELEDKKYLFKEEFIEYKKKCNDVMEGVLLNGACFVFSPDFVSKYNGLYDKTFLYMEEDCLKLQMDFECRKMIYSPELHIKHKGSSSTKKVEADEIKRCISNYKYHIQSVRAYRRLIFKLKLKPVFVIHWIHIRIKRYLIRKK